MTAPSVTLKVTRHGKEFRFAKMWWYIKKIPGNHPRFPLPYYYYIGITTRTDPTMRDKEHIERPHPGNKKFDAIRKITPPHLWKTTHFELPIIGNNGEQNLDRLKTLERQMIAAYDTFHGPHGLNATPGGEDPFAGLKFQQPQKTLGAYWTIIKKQPGAKNNINFVYQINRTHTPYFAITSTKASTFLKKMNDHPDVSLDKIFYDFQHFMYCATAATLGYYDLDQKKVRPNFQSEKEYNNCYTWSLDRIQDAINALKVAETLQQVILDRGKLLQPKTINT